MAPGHSFSDPLVPQQVLFKVVGGCCCCCCEVTLEMGDSRNADSSHLMSKKRSDPCTVYTNLMVHFIREDISSLDKIVQCY